VIDLWRRDIGGGQREQHHRRIGWIDFAIAGLAREIGGKLATSGVDGGLNIAGGGVDIAIQIKLQNDAGIAKAAGRSHLRDASNTAELTAERSGDGRRHGYWGYGREDRCES